MNQSIIVLLLLGIASVSSVPYAELIGKEWDNYKLKHSKVYHRPEEDTLRRSVYSEKRLKIAAHNRRYIKGEVTYKIGLNEHSDMTDSEVFALRSCVDVDRAEQPRIGKFFEPTLEELSPLASLDWRLKGAVTGVKNQGNCGSCWTFSSTGALEGQQFLQTGKLVSLSEQNILDCDTDGYGCSGGWMYTAFQYIKKNGGIDTEKSYPYQAMKGSCLFKSGNSSVGATDTGFLYIPQREDALRQAVTLLGPISTAFYAEESFLQYKEGVYKCSDDHTDINHAVLIVGYGTTEKGQDYWLVKNSWGEDFGEKGYFKIERGTNTCNFEDYGIVPLVT